MLKYLIVRNERNTRTGAHASARRIPEQVTPSSWLSVRSHCYPRAKLGTAELLVGHRQAAAYVGSVLVPSKRQSSYCLPGSRPGPTVTVPCIRAGGSSRRVFGSSFSFWKQNGTPAAGKHEGFACPQRKTARAQSADAKQKR